MKKTVFVILSLIICFALCACADKKDNDSVTVSDTVTESESFEETTSGDSTAEITTAEETTQAPYDWKADGVSVLSEYIDTDAVYSVYDLNNDNVPEIIICNGTTSADTKYYLYDFMNSVDEPIEFGSGNCMLCGFDGDIILQYCKMGYETITRYSYGGGKLKEEILLDREVPIDEDYLSFEALNSFSVNDLSGLSWLENPTDGNLQIINSVK